MEMAKNGEKLIVAKRSVRCFVLPVSLLLNINNIVFVNRRKKERPTVTSPVMSL